MASKEQVDAILDAAYSALDTVPHTVAHAFAAVAWQWCDQAAEIEGDGKRGSKAGSASLRAAAGYAADLATSIAPELASYLANRANGLPISEEIDEPAKSSTVNDVLDRVAGPMPPIIPPYALDDRQSIINYLSGDNTGPTISEVAHDARVTAQRGDTDPIVRTGGDTGRVLLVEAAASEVSAVMPDVVSAPPYSNGEAPATLTWSDLATPVDGARRPGHRSVSQLEQYGQCGLKYRLSRYHDVPQTPAWWFVGGRALHAAIADFERDVAGEWKNAPTAGGAWISVGLAKLWNEALLAEVMSTIDEHPGVPMDTWQVGGKGKEDFAWWTTRGAEMLHAYIAARCTGELAGFEHWAITPLIETKFTLDVGDLSVEGFIDLAGPMGGDMWIIDHKAGSRVPEDDLQLKAYAVWLSEKFSPYQHDDVKVGYWMARKGELAGVKTIDVAAARQEVEYRFAAMDAAERAGIYMPQPSNFCKSCSVRSACPARKE